MAKERGGFTIPGEAGREQLTKELAEKWGADVVRDSDGTELSEEILKSGMDVYSTICIIRGHNTWAVKNPDKLQQSFLCTEPVTAVDSNLTIHPLEGFYRAQFRINDSAEAMEYWQVYDRTTGEELDRKLWSWNAAAEQVEIQAVPWHRYTVSFLVYRIWEEISMYNHVTNDWGDKEHLMPIDPMYPETQEYLLSWMRNWCETHPNTNVVRFTSMFYNFVWIWGSDESRQNLFTDWGSYDFTVSVAALKGFEKEYGYRMTAEDFINQGKLHVTHQPATQHKRDWMQFIHRFVVSYGKKLIDIVHEYGKKAYVFYDDSWVGVEPYSEDFEEFGFDGIIKCVFSGFEVRLCSGVKAKTHEIRLHPYLFPVGLGGLPTFAEGGNPTLDAKKYWVSVRRALLRAPIERTGLGGYLHLTEGFPDFNDCIENIADEFRAIGHMHEAGKPWTCKKKAAVLHYWGSLRSWTLSGHFHETYMNDLIHINEALSGLPFDVEFISFEDVKNRDLSGYDVIINAGREGDAWSGGESWKDPEVIAKLTQWVYEGGTFLGVNEPSAVAGMDTRFAMAHVLGIDKDFGERICHGKWPVSTAENCPYQAVKDVDFEEKKHLYLTEKDTVVYRSAEGIPQFTEHAFGKGRGIYMTSFVKENANIRFLAELIASARGGAAFEELPYTTEDIRTECAYFPECGKTVVINNADQEVETAWKDKDGEKHTAMLQPFESLILS